ncbi:MBL fold metallo-hydrolase [Brachybacterium sp. Z12]|uniref:MBL fold metallo-hydrolase n=1 Tax=Brachybacterium sp. Z12 TaxID=2759167 RepID=UPI00223AC09E|nr:MBL fold metallo-hydrolase [Brachybacterium sp. Z12]
MLLIARTADALPGSRISVPEGATGALLAIAVVLVAAIALAARRLPLVRWIVTALLVTALAPGVGRLLPVSTGPDWSLALCAVGQGDAVLLRLQAPTRDGPTILLDTGPDPAALRQCLDRLQVTRIDLLVLTHPHQDHTGGVDALNGRRQPAEQWVCPLPEAATQVAAGARSPSPPPARPGRGPGSPCACCGRDLRRTRSGPARHWEDRARGTQRMTARSRSRSSGRMAPA